MQQALHASTASLRAVSFTDMVIGAATQSPIELEAQGALLAEVEDEEPHSEAAADQETVAAMHQDTPEG